MDRAPLADVLEELLNAYLRSSGERELFLASELGRRLARSGTRPEELLAAHVTAMQRILERLPPTAVADGALRSYHLLLDALMAYFLPYEAPPAISPRNDDDQAASTPLPSAPLPSVPPDAFGLEDLYRRARDRAAQFRDVVEVGNALIGARDLPRALRATLERALELTGGAAGTVWLLDEGEAELSPAAEIGAGGPNSDCLARRAIEAGRPLMNERQAGRDRDAERSRAFALPLIPPDGAPVGALTVCCPDGPARGADDQLDLLRLLASQLGAAIANARAYLAVADHQRALQDLVSRLITAQEDERRQVAYDIHGGLAQTTAATFQQLQLLAESEPRSPRARAHLEIALGAGQRAVTEARQLIAALRPTVLDDFGLAAAIAREVEALRGEDREVAYENTLGGARLPELIETTLYRAGQEALTNVRKHAGPSPVRVTLGRTDGEVRLEVRDWGRGLQAPVADASGGGYQLGLASMRERLTLVGGTCAITAAEGGGTLVVAIVPLERA